MNITYVAAVKGTNSNNYWPDANQQIVCGKLLKPHLLQLMRDVLYRSSCFSPDNKQIIFNRLFSALKTFRPDSNQATTKINFDDAVINAATNSFNGAT